MILRREFDHCDASNLSRHGCVLWFVMIRRWSAIRQDCKSSGKCVEDVEGIRDGMCLYCTVNCGSFTKIVAKNLIHPISPRARLIECLVQTDRLHLWMKHLAVGYLLPMRFRRPIKSRDLGCSALWRETWDLDYWVDYAEYFFANSCPSGFRSLCAPRYFVTCHHGTNGTILLYRNRWVRYWPLGPGLLK